MTMKTTTKGKILKFIKLRHKHCDDFLLTDTTLYSKLDAYSKLFVNGIDVIHPYKVIYRIPNEDEMFIKGFKQALLFDSRYD